MSRCILVATVTLLAACSSSSPTSSGPATDVADAESIFDSTVAAEGGVPILTSDAEILGDPTIVYAHFDEPSDDVLRLLAPTDDSTTPIINVEIAPRVSLDASGANTELSDGRPAISGQSSTGMTRITFSGSEDQWVQLSSFELGEPALIELANRLDVGNDAEIAPLDDWAVVGDVDLPFYENGHQTLFDAPELPGVQVEIYSSRLTGDLDLWYEWTIAERIEDARFEWAFRQRSSEVGSDRFVALWDDDVVVEIHNVVDDDVLADVIDGLRAMRPGESELAPPAPAADSAP